MDGNVDQVMYRWGRGDPSGHGREEIHVVRCGNRWRVRRVANRHTPDLPATSESHALQIALRLQTRDWEELPADPSADIRARIAASHRQPRR